jgi:hypothetical protein
VIEVFETFLESTPETTASGEIADEELALLDFLGQSRGVVLARK